MDLLRPTVFFGQKYLTKVAILKKTTRVQPLLFSFLHLSFSSLFVFLLSFFEIDTRVLEFALKLIPRSRNGLGQFFILRARKFVN